MARDTSGTPRITDGSLDFTGGVDSSRVTTMASDANPNGLRRNNLAWLVNGTLRDGGITPRAAWIYRSTIADGTKWYQGGAVYEPDNGYPYLIMSIGGRIITATLDTYSVADRSTVAAQTHPNVQNYAYFCQAEYLMMIQAGDYASLPLYWTGNTVGRSNGFLGVGNAGNEIPPAGPMDYYMGRLWYAGVPTRRHYCAGDMVQGATGSAAVNYRNSVLTVTENPMAIGGDGFVVPTNAGNITALKHTANINTQLGISELFVFTRKAIYSLNVPVTRADWIIAGNGRDGTVNPVQKVIQQGNGSVNDRTVLSHNGDLFYQSLEPGIRSLAMTIRNSQQWGNIPISANIDRLLKFTNRGLMSHCSGAVFGNRLLQTGLPKIVGCGVVSQVVAPMDFDPITSYGSENLPIWEGMYEGLNILQMFGVDYGGLERLFVTAVSQEDGTIQLWELVEDERFDYDDRRITMVIETPSFTWNAETVLKELETMELWVDRLYGDVNFKVEYRPDFDPCWYLWHEWKKCTARNSCEDIVNPVCYPLQTYNENYRASDSLPKPQNVCQSMMGRPTNIGYQFQVRITVKGFCRIRGMAIHALVRDEPPFQNLVCYHAFEEGDHRL